MSAFGAGSFVFRFLSEMNKGHYRNTGVGRMAVVSMMLAASELMESNKEY